MKFIDTHAHLDTESFADDLGAVLAESRARGVSRWINVGYNEERWRSTLSLARRTPGMSFMLGLHPGEADSWSDALSENLARLARDTGPVAIGEIGIDLYWRQDNLDLQREAFVAQLRLARELALPAVIHMRDADNALADVLETVDHLPHIHFHSFDGNARLRDWVLDHGATIGVGGLITRRGSEDLQRWVANVPRERVVLETDAPYLKPRGIRGTRNQPAYLVKVAQLIAELWHTSVDDVARITSTNAERIFQLPQEDK